MPLCRLMLMDLIGKAHVYVLYELRTEADGAILCRVRHSDFAAGPTCTGHRRGGLEE